VDRLLARDPTLLWYDIVLTNNSSKLTEDLSAVKCNPDPYVIRLLASLGAGFDCASNGEINQVLSIGGGNIDPSRIIFANPCKAVSFIRAAARAGVETMTFDNADELYKVAKAHPHAKMVIRILTDDSKSLCAFGIKFGAPLAVVPSLLAKAKELNLDVIGVSFHVGSGCYDPLVYRDAIARARAVFNMAKNVGYEFTLLDVGGGFEDQLFEKAAGVLRSAIREHFPEEERREKGIRLIAEPGRYYVSTAFRLAVNVIARRAPMDGAKGCAAPSKDGEAQPEVMCKLCFRCQRKGHLCLTVTSSRLCQRRSIRGVQLYSIRPSDAVTSSVDS
jgi:ornithine decarboxylase